MSLLGTIAGFVSGVGSTVGNLIGLNQTNKTNKQIARETNESNAALWREQAKYNSPSEYMKRLQEAGLNPQLAYGNLGQTFASSPPQMQAAKMEAPHIQLGDAAQMIGAFSNAAKLTEEAKESRERQKLLNTQENALVNDMLLKDAQRIKLGAESNLLKYDYDFKTSLRDVYTDMAHAQLEQYRATIAKTKSEIALQQVQQNLAKGQLEKLFEETQNIRSIRTEQDAKNALWKIGINPNATGWDLVVGQIYKNPEQFNEKLKQIISSFGFGSSKDKNFKVGPHNNFPRWIANKLFNTN